MLAVPGSRRSSASAAATSRCACGSTGSLRRRRARPRRALHRPDARLARGRRRARPLHRRADGARGADARLPRDLLRLGSRPRTHAQRRLPPLRARRASPRPPTELRAAVARALAERAPASDFAALPSAASLVVVARQRRASRRCGLSGARPAGAGAARRLVRPGGGARLPAARGRCSRSRCGSPAVAGIALTFDDGPHPEGTPAVLAELERAMCARPSSSSASRSRRTRRSRPRSPPPVTRSASTATATSCCSGAARLRSRLTSTGPPRRSARRPGSRAASTGRPTASSASPGSTLARRRWQPLLWSRWGRDWEATRER